MHLSIVAETVGAWAVIIQNAQTTASLEASVLNAGKWGKTEFKAVTEKPKEEHDPKEPATSPAKTKKKPTTLLLVGGITVLVLISFCFICGVFGTLLGPSSSSNTSGSNKEGFPAYNSPWDGSVSQVETYLRETLKDPGSIEFVEWFDIKKHEDHFVVRCTYRAKNSFGGFVFKDQVFHLDPKTGDVFGVTDMN